MCKIILCCNLFHSWRVCMDLKLWLAHQLLFFDWNYQIVICTDLTAHLVTKSLVLQHLILITKDSFTHCDGMFLQLGRNVMMRWLHKIGTQRWRRKSVEMRCGLNSGTKQRHKCRTIYSNAIMARALSQERGLVIMTYFKILAKAVSARWFIQISLSHKRDVPGSCCCFRLRPLRYGFFLFWSRWGNIRPKTKLSLHGTSAKIWLA